MARRPPTPEIEIKLFKTGEEIDRAIVQLQRRIQEIEKIDFAAAVMQHTGADDVAENNVRNTILEVYGPHSPEYDQHKHLSIWAGGMFVGMEDYEIVEGKRRGAIQTIGILKGLVDRLKEKIESPSQNRRCRTRTLCGRPSF